jgi:nitric oxide reductase NorD protein
MADTPLKELALADPELARCLEAAMNRRTPPLAPGEHRRMVDHILEGVALEVSFGLTLARGYAGLVPDCDADHLGLYRRTVREAGRTGPTLGRLMAGHLVPVLRAGDPAILDRFIQTTGIMLKKGTYTLNRPLDVLDTLLDSGESAAAMAFLDLLAETFSHEMSYNRSLHLTAILPRAVAGFSPPCRPWQIHALHRVLRADRRLAEPFLDGMQKGLALLSRDGLARFVDDGLARYRENHRRGSHFLALASVAAVDAFDDLQTTVSLAAMESRLNRYLQARTGSRLAVRPLSALPGSLAPASKTGVAACSDGRFIYLPETVGLRDHRTQNAEIYQCLVRLESAYLEFDSFVFDLERVMDRCGPPLGRPGPSSGLSDMELFFRQFDNPQLAEALLTIAEHGRLHRCMTRRYPGMARRIQALLGKTADRFRPAGPSPVLNKVYDHVVRNPVPAPSFGPLAGAVNAFNARVETAATVEDCALAVRDAYPAFAALAGTVTGRLLSLPFGRRLRPDLYRRAHARADQRAAALCRRLRDKGVVVYKSDIDRRLDETGGTLTPDDIRQMAARAAHGVPGARPGHTIALLPAELTDLLGTDFSPTRIDVEPAAGPVSWYREWDAGQNDYLDRHCRVVEKKIPATGSGDVFAETLGRHQGLVRRVRYAFELLRPESLAILRQWTEGDEFDYRALLDFAMDRRAGLIPSDRLYIKRIKQQRDVAVLLLVDLSRSTANCAGGHGSESVLAVEKEALVLFCEALSVVGDRFAIAGFSGSGRLGVDYYPIKEFDQPVDGSVRRRISSMMPRRSTRMGAAIRHAAARFEAVPAAVRLLILLGDGFPNDVDYKRRYAIEDTRRAINESRSKNIFTHGITVNLSADHRLDDLYGNLHHNVISNVRELPDKLIRIYRALTG